MLLSNIGRHFAVYLPGVQGQGEGGSHVVLDGGGNRGFSVGRAHGNLARAQVLELAGAGLGDFDVGNQGEDDIGRVSLLQVGFDAEGICGVHQDTGVLGGDDGFDDRGQVVDLRERLYAEDDIVVYIFTRRGFFGGPNHCTQVSCLI